VIVGFDRDAPVESIGRKGHNLSRMWQAGLPVPRGFCIPCEIMESIAANDLIPALEQLETRAFAVRSSAVNEDAAETSFAGVLLSRLNVRDASGVICALQQIRRSASSIAAARYIERLNVAAGLQAAAVVQTFIPAEASGVLFMRAPASRSGEFLVEATWGLGPAVVDGLVRPDRWLVSTEGAIISAHVADKDIAVVAAEHEGTTQISVDPPCRRRACVTPESLRELARLASECQRLLGAPQDVEWAVHDGRLWLLQSRPITR